VVSKCARFESSSKQHVGNIAREGVQNTCHWSGATDDATDEWLPQWRHDPAWPTPFSVAVSVRPDHGCVFCTPSLAIVLTYCNQSDSNLANWGGINFGVPFCYNSMVARVWRAFQVSQGSVETLFRWGEKRLHGVAANLFRKRFTKFHQNRQSFMEDYR